MPSLVSESSNFGAGVVLSRGAIGAAFERFAQIDIPFLDKGKEGRRRVGRSRKSGGVIHQHVLVDFVRWTAQFGVSELREVNDCFGVCHGLVILSFFGLFGEKGAHF